MRDLIGKSYVPRLSDPIPGNRNSCERMKFKLMPESKLSENSVEHESSVIVPEMPRKPG